MSLGGGTNRILWIAAGVLAVVGLIGLILLFGQGGGDDDDSGGTPTSEATSTTEEASGYNATIEANFMNSCTETAQPGQAVCQCIYDKIVATVPFDRFVEIDQQLNEDDTARPQELVDIATECSSETTTP